MTTRPNSRLAALLLSLFVAHAHAADDRSAETARIDQLKGEAQQVRDQADAQYESTEAACYARFMVNRCIDQAKQARLEEIRRARVIEAEARKLELAERQRVAAEVIGAGSAAPPSPAAPDAPLSPATRATPAAPSPDAVIAPNPEAERVRADRARAAEQAEIDARAAQAAKDAERARQRSKADEEAAQRAAQAARERARYEERIREFEEKKARDAAGR